MEAKYLHRQRINDEKDIANRSELEKKIIIQLSLLLKLLNKRNTLIIEIGRFRIQRNCGITIFTIFIYRIKLKETIRGGVV